MSDLRNNYVVAHGYDESGRLYLQDWLWKVQLGYDLHPSIQLPETGDVCIADLGCGNAAWLVSLAIDFERKGKKASFMGFDVQSSQFPTAENLPENIKLGYLDAFTDALPEEHIGAYDILHIRAFSSVVKAGNPGPLLKNAFKMLKPGGYLQWDDMDGGSFRAVAPGSDPESSPVSTKAAQELVSTSLESQKVAMSLRYEWMHRFDDLFKEHGFEAIENKRMQTRKELRNPHSISLLLIHDHIARKAVVNGKMIGTDKDWAELWAKAGVEIEQGVSLLMDMVIAVGRKPML